VLVIALQIVSVRIVTGQQKYNIQHFDTRDGLASMAINAIEQDSIGFIWIQYYGGLSRFDGYNFKVYKHDPNDTLHSPGRGTVGVLITDNSNNIWINNLGSTEKSLYQYDYQKDIFIRHQPDLKNAHVRRLYFDKKKPILWIGTTDGRGLWSYDLKSREIINFINPHTDSVLHLKRNHIHAIMDLDSSLLITTMQGLWLFNKLTHEFKRPNVNPRDSALLYHADIRTIMTDGIITNEVWLNIPGYKYQDTLSGLFNEGGIYILDLAFSIKGKYEYPKGFGYRWYGPDGTGCLWFNSNMGLIKFNPRDTSWVQIEPELINSFSNDNINLTGFDRDRENNIWLGSNNGLYIMKELRIEFDNRSIPESNLYSIMSGATSDSIVSD
jgi:ligand-binding sensor domain-containing protein